MGSSQSIEAIENDHNHEEDEEEEDLLEEEDDDDDDDDDDGDDNDNDTGVAQSSSNNNHLLLKKVLEQEPEMLPCYASASPLSPQLSSLGTPRLGPSIKVWDPYNVLAPPPQLPPPPVFSRSFSSTSVQSNNNGIDDERMVTEVYLISHGECELDFRPDLVPGRCVDAASALTGNGKRQARALAVFLNSQGVRFNAVYASPLDRARATAVSVCQEMNFAEERIQSFDELSEMSYGQWEGCLRSEVYTPEILSLIDHFQSDFSAPSGESLRQVQFRMVQFLNKTVLGLPDKLRSDFSSTQQNESQVHDRDGSSPSLQSHNWDLLHRQRLGLTRKKSGKSRLQFVTKTEAEDDFSLQNSVHDQMNSRGSTSSITSFVGIFSHSVPIKCLITGLLECSPVMSHKICIDDPSVSVLQHSWRTGWQIKRLNDTAHLRLV